MMMMTIIIITLFKGYPGRLSNVAIRKNADQSSVTQRGTANTAVDGFPWNRPPWCALTNPDVDGTKRRWWRVNLAGLYRIYYLIIHTQDTNGKVLAKAAFVCVCVCVCVSVSVCVCVCVKERERERKRERECVCV